MRLSMLARADLHFLDLRSAHLGARAACLAARARLTLPGAAWAATSGDERGHGSRVPFGGPASPFPPHGETMKGLELSRQFFLEWGLPFLRREHPEWADRVAAGRFAGSEAIGADDELSRDHGWGPNFALYLPAVDYAQIGRR